MSLPELQSWLVEEGLNEELDELTHLTVRSELDNLVELTASDQIGPTARLAAPFVSRQHTWPLR